MGTPFSRGFGGVAHFVLEDANSAIWDAYLRAGTRRAGRERYPSLIRALDEALFELEELNLLGVDRAPAALRDRVTELFALVPGPDAAELRIRYRVIPLMDALFRAQELVFRAKHPNRPPADDDEAEQRSA